jgi:peptidylprolyl isomerase
MMRRLSMLSTLSMAAALLSASLISSSAGAAEVVASAKDVSISDAEVALLLADAHVAPGALTAAVLDQVVRLELTRKLLLAQARAAAFDRDSDTARALLRAADTELIARYMARQSAAPAGYPSEAQLRAAFDANPGRFWVPQRVRLAHIYLPGNTDANRQKIAAMRATLARDPGAFAALALQESNDPVSAANGGELDWVATSRLEPDVAAAIAGAPPGNAVLVVTNSKGFRIVRVLARADAEPAQFDTIRAELAVALKAQKVRENEQAYLDAMLAAAPPKVDPAAIERAVLSNQTGAAAIPQ